jgi:hypothetical protein
MRWVLLINITLAYLDNIAIWIGYPDRAPSWYKGIKVQRTQGDPGIFAHLGQLGVDVVHLKSDVTPARIPRPVLTGWWDGYLFPRPEKLEVGIPRFYKDDLVCTKRYDSRSLEAEVFAIESLGNEWISAGYRDV